jgi:hypothetical protein
VCVFAAIEQQIEDTDTMEETIPELWVFWIPRVVKPGYLNTKVVEGLFFDVTLGRWAGDVFSSASLSAKISQALCFALN